MPKVDDKELERIANEFGLGRPALTEQLLDALRKEVDAAPEDLVKEARSAFEALGGDKLIAGLPPIRRERAAKVSSERIVSVKRGSRPVTRVFDNEVTLEFLGPFLPFWRDLIAGAKRKLDAAIPAVGRVELTNSDESWCGTAWLIDDDILVTNRHVAERFARRDVRSSRFVFRNGLFGGPIASHIDFVEEERRQDSDEHPITSILWIAGPDEPDVAFLRVTPRPGRRLPDPIPLATEVKVDRVVAAIGYPARDDSIHDQSLVIEIFGNDVYEKKRLAPGQIRHVETDIVHHDCSTLGGNSGSVLVDFESGEAVGLHYGGYLDDSVNLAVPAPYLRELLDRAKSVAREAEPSITRMEPSVSAVAAAASPPAVIPTSPGTYKLNLFVPIEIEVRVAAPQSAPQPASTVSTPHPASVATRTESPLEAAVRTATERLSGHPNVLRVRAGWRFKNGWITDEPAVVVLVRSKRGYGDLRSSGEPPLPREIDGIGVDVRTAPLAMQLAALGIERTVLERPSKPAGYVEPPGYDDPTSDLHLGRVQEVMDATFHISPESAFAELRRFFSRVRRHVTATMYEWDSDEISDLLERAINDNDARLRMVTQRRGVRGRDATEAAVRDMKRRIGDAFDHVWASVTGPKRLIQSSYHIKVASRDDEELWLSSGNWKGSNQPVDPQMPGALMTNNRDWHVILKNPRLASLFKRYVEFDFEEAQRVADEAEEAPELVDVDLFVPIDVSDEARRRLPEPTYEPTLEIENERLDVQPLLTPDRDRYGRRMFMRFATDLVRRATRTLYIQNQSLRYTDANNREFDAFFEAVQAKQQEIDDVRIITRDGREFGPESAADQQEDIERLKELGLDVSRRSLRLQRRCHTKAIIVDGREVLFGSHNLTNMGSLHNRDASLLVRSAKVATFFQDVFLYDWENLTHNDAEERRGGIRRAQPGEETPPGFRRVKLSELIED